MRSPLRPVLAIPATLLGGCLAVAGLDGDYQLGTAAAGASPTGSGGTSSGGSTTVGGGGTSSTTSSGGGGASPTENCLNGIDDDGDGLADCDDSDCEDHACVNAVPDAIAIFVAPHEGQCPAGTTERELHRCTGCTCNATAGSCTFRLSSYPSGCSGTAYGSTTSTGCWSGFPDTNKHYAATLTPNDDGTCEPAAETVTATSFVGCELPSLGGYCSDGGWCVPDPSSHELYVLISGWSCPDGTDWAGRIYEGPGTTCSCDCDTNAEICDPLRIRTYVSTNNCTGSSTDHQIDASCQSVGYTMSVHIEPATSTVQCQRSHESDSGEEQGRLCRFFP